ncbi:MAG: hypothetical protein K2H02_01060 [Anaeroplasmataceae bacterium]|nr:hypothetical protein [Anaeroplasmataceae bacterium]
MKKIILFCSCFLFLMLASCADKKPHTDPLTDFSNTISNSIGNVKNATIKCQMKEKDILVAELEKTITITESTDDTYKGSAVVVKRMVGNDFKFTEEKSTQEWNSSKEELPSFSIKLDENSFSTHSIENGVLKATIKEEAIKDVLNVSDLKNKGAVQLEIVLKDDCISQLSINYETVSLRVVTIVSEYSY